MSRISNEKIKALTLSHCNQYSKGNSKGPQKIQKHTIGNFTNAYKTSLK